jgi:hypothetical protein
MEIGYAAALGVPVVAVTTDFQTYGLASDGPALDFPDPLLSAVLSAVIRVHRLEPSPAGEADRFRAFSRRNLLPLRTAADTAIAALLSARQLPPPRIPRLQRRAYLEPSPYIPRDLWRDARDALAGLGWDVHVATRFHDLGRPRPAAAADWAASQTAALTLVDIAGPETPAGAAILTGACAATGRRVLAAAAPGSWTFAAGREPNWRNLMIQYAINGRFATMEDLAVLAGTP